MSPRASLPGADELFRTTLPTNRSGPSDAGPAAAGPADEMSDTSGASGRETAITRGVTRGRRGGSGGRTSTGRERHEEKITVYVSAAELVDLERARLTLRAEHGIAVDRGRIVREALSVLLADLDGKAGESILVRRLAEI